VALLAGDPVPKIAEHGQEIEHAVRQDEASLNKLNE
jgi:hypothetical protein